MKETEFVVGGQVAQMNEHLRVEFPTGEMLRNGIGVSSSPATETFHQWRELWKYGAGYIVIKTANHKETVGVRSQTRMNKYREGNLTTLENIGKTSMEQKPIYELVKEIKTAREEGIFVIPSITSKNPDLSIWREMIDAVASTDTPFFESTLRYPYRGIIHQVVDELRKAYGCFEFDLNEYNVGILPVSISRRAGLDLRYVEIETNRRFETFLKSLGKYSTQKRVGMIAKLWGGRHDMPAVIATCALAGVKGITLINSFQSPPLTEFSDMQEYKRANVSGADLRRIRNAALEAAQRTLQDHDLPRVTLFASGGVAVELASQNKEGLAYAIQDIILCLELGADAVQLYTAIHQDYSHLGNLIQELSKKLEKENKTFRNLAKNKRQFTGRNKPIYRLFRINQDSCVGCGLCEKIGYCDAIWPTETQAVINKNLTTFEIHPNNCTGCGLCVKVCPVEGTITPSCKAT